MYGAGDLGLAMAYTIQAAYFAIFLTDVVGISPKVAAAAIFFGRTWDYVNDPFIGYLSDRTRSRWGRRRPFLLFGALPFALVFALMWWRPPLEGEILLAVYYGLLYALFDTAATCVSMPYAALTPELTSDYDERTELTATRMFFSLSGSLLAFTVPLMIVDGFRPEQAERVLWMGISFGIANALPLLLTFFGTREREEFMYQKPFSALKSVQAAARNRAFLFGLGLFLFTWAALSIIEAVLLYYIKYVVERESQSGLIMATIFATAMLFLPLWQWASRKLNKRLAYITGVTCLAFALLGMALLNAATSLAVLLALCVLAGSGVAAAHVLTWAIIPDAIEAGEMQTGQRNEGMYYSLVTLAQKIASSVAVPLALLVLNAMGYVSSSAIQPESAINGIRIVAGPIPALIMFAGILFAIFYPLERESYTEIAQQLEIRRKAKAAQTD